MIIKLREELKGQHIHTTVFCGEQGQTFQNCGTLIMDRGQWMNFGVALILGARRMHGRLSIETPDDAIVMKELESYDRSR